MNNVREWGGGLLLAELKKTLQYYKESQITAVKSSSKEITNFILQQLLYSDIHNNILKVWLPKAMLPIFFPITSLFTSC